MIQEEKRLPNVLVEVTSPKCESVRDLQREFKTNLREYFKVRKISYADLAGMMREQGSSIEFHTVRALRNLIEGGYPWYMKFGNELEYLMNVSEDPEFKMRDFAPLKSMHQGYCKVAEDAGLPGINGEESAREAIKSRLYFLVIGAE